MIKVLHMVHKFYPLRSGTSERIYYSQPKDGFAYYIIRPRASGDSPQYRYTESFYVYTIDLNSWLPRRLTVRSQVMRLESKATEIIERENIDIICGHNPVVFAKAALRVKSRFPSLALVYEAHYLMHSDYEEKIHQRFPYLPKTALCGLLKFLTTTEKEILERADAVICQTEKLADILSRLYAVARDKCVIAYNGVSEDLIECDEEGIRHRYRLPKSGIAFYGGHLSAANGLYHIIDLITRMPDICFVIAGDGECESQLTDLQKSQPNLRFVGAINKQDYMKIASVADVLLFLRPLNRTNHIFLALKVLDAVKLNKYILSSRLDIMTEFTSVYDRVVFTGLIATEIADNLRLALEMSKATSDSRPAAVNPLLRWKTTNNRIDSLYRSLLCRAQ